MALKTKLTCAVTAVFLSLYPVAFLSSTPITEPVPATTPIPFQIGEKLFYTLKWGSIPVGKAVFEILDGEPSIGEPSHLFRVFIRSNPFVDLIYKVRDAIESYTDPSMKHALLYKKKQREGRHKRDVRVQFDWEQKKAYYYNKGQHEKTVDLVPGTFDPLSVFYAFRLHPLVDDLEVEQPVTDGKKVVMGRAKIIHRETVAVEAGEFDTYLVQPELKHIGGVFKKSDDAKLNVWVTADEKRIVVKIKSKVVVGHFTGELVGFEGIAPEGH